ncbi:MAG: ATP-binding cassette domain-containing protein [Deltaproteobacteria bacterium]|jgi:lincosamide and streptogramin A transport system ATP-binding/permease protein|nr:ATP-binding cassette domain-containing protein [Deltaproteobacteria bacterium]
MALIGIANLSFAHDGGRMIFDKLSLRIDTTWKLGLIGRNGRGKTTFLKLLLGEYAYSGSIHAPTPMEYFPFAVENPSLPGFEVARRIRPDLENWMLEREASLLELSPTALARPFNTLSGGEGAKLLLAALFLRDNHFLLIDEPTNHLDLQARQTLGKYLQSKQGFILVSHDRSLLNNCIDHVLSINKADMELQRGNFASWEQNRAWKDQHEQEEHSRLKKEAVRLEESAGRAAAWSALTEKGKYGAGPVDRGFIGHKAAKMMQRAKSVEARRRKAVEEKKQLLHNLENETPLSMHPLAFHSARTAELRGVSVRCGDTLAVRDVSLRVMTGERVALQGRNGSGKTSLLKALAGLLVPCRGDMHLPKSLRVSYVPQDTSFLAGTLNDFIHSQGLDGNLFRAVLHRFGFDRGRLFDVDMVHFSAGWKKKALLAASLCQEAHLYVWDEPLNHIDVISRMQIENLVLKHRPTLVFVEHDQTFLQRVATRILNMDPAEDAGRRGHI